MKKNEIEIQNSRHEFVSEARKLFEVLSVRIAQKRSPLKKMTDFFSKRGDPKSLNNLPPELSTENKSVKNQ